MDAYVLGWRGIMTTYSKKTWVSNETITTAAMNNIETGIDDSFKTSEMIGDGTLDMSGNGISNATYIYSDTHKVVASDDLIYTDDSLQILPGSSGTGAYIKFAEYASPSGISPGSSLRIEVSAKENQPDGFYKIYVNGVAAGAEHSLTTSVVVYSDDISFGGGDLIQIYGKVTQAATQVQVSKVDISYVDPFSGFVKNAV